MTVTVPIAVPVASPLDAGQNASIGRFYRSCGIAFAVNLQASASQLQALFKPHPISQDMVGAPTSIQGLQGHQTTLHGIDFSFLR